MDIHSYVIYSRPELGSKSFNYKSVSTFLIWEILSEWKIEFILPYFMGNFQTNARNQLTGKCPLTFSHYTRAYLEYGGYVYVKNKLIFQIYSLVYKFNVFFIRLENLVYQNNPEYILSKGNHQYNIQHSMNWILRSRY